MNRREMLFGTAGLVTTLLSNPFAVVPSPKPTWFTHAELMWLYGKVNGRSTNLVNDLTKLPDDLTEYMSFYISVIRVSNVMHRKTLNTESQHWMVISPSLVDVFPRWSYTTTDGTRWEPRDWKRHALEEVSPGVWRIGTWCGRYRIYVDERFHENVALLGMGYKTVKRYTVTQKDGEYVTHERIGPTTTKHYGVIQCTR